MELQYNVGVGSDTKVVIDDVERDIPHSVCVHHLLWRQLCVCVCVWCVCGCVCGVCVRVCGWGQE